MLRLFLLMSLVVTQILGQHLNQQYGRQCESTVTLPETLLENIIGCRAARDEGNTLQMRKPRENSKMIDLNHLRGQLHEQSLSDRMIKMIIASIDSEPQLKVDEKSARQGQDCTQVTVNIPPQEVEGLNEQLQAVISQNNHILLAQINTLFRLKIEALEKKLEEIVGNSQPDASLPGSESSADSNPAEVSIQAPAGSSSRYPKPSENEAIKPASPASSRRLDTSFPRRQAGSSGLRRPSQRNRITPSPAVVDKEIVKNTKISEDIVKINEDTPQDSAPTNVRRFPPRRKYKPSRHGSNRRRPDPRIHRGPAIAEDVKSPKDNVVAPKEEVPTRIEEEEQHEQQQQMVNENMENKDIPIDHLDEVDEIYVENEEQQEISPDVEGEVVISTTEDIVEIITQAPSAREKMRLRHSSRRQNRLQLRRNRS